MAWPERKSTLVNDIMNDLDYKLEHLLSLRALGELSETDYKQQRQVLLDQAQDKSVNSLLIAALLIGIVLTGTLYASAKQSVHLSATPSTSATP